MLVWLNNECESGIDFELLKEGEKRVCLIHYNGEVATSAEVTDDYALPICKALVASGVAAETDYFQIQAEKDKRERRARSAFDIQGPEPHWGAEEEARAAAFPG